MSLGTSLWHCTCFGKCQRGQCNDLVDNLLRHCEGSWQIAWLFHPIEIGLIRAVMAKHDLPLDPFFESAGITSGSTHIGIGLRVLRKNRGVTIAHAVAAAGVSSIPYRGLKEASTLRERLRSLFNMTSGSMTD